MSDVSECPGYRVGITFNLKRKKNDEYDDEQAEYDSISTIEAIGRAINGAGCEVVFLEADAELPWKLQKLRPDIVFNIAEGKGGRGREAQVPSILNLYSIPFTGSDETTLCIALDKSLAKRIVRSSGIKTPAFFVWKDDDTVIPSNLHYPVIVKPNAEGSSKGLVGVSVANSRSELIGLLREKRNRYRQPLLVEEYIQGREFTVGILGNGSSMRVFRPMEIIVSPEGNPDSSRIYSFQVKNNFQKYVKYKCPAEIGSEIEEKLIKTSAKIYELLECLDFARIDYILSEDNEVYFIEINPLPGLAPGYSDYPMLAEFNGMGYNELVLEILNCGLKRHGMQAV